MCLTYKQSIPESKWYRQADRISGVTIFNSIS